MSGARCQVPGPLRLGSRDKDKRMSIKSYRDLKVWQKAMDLVVESYKVVNLLPKNEVTA